jgi:hypothetical protein
MNNCLYCNKETNNPKFCSHSCANSYNNKIYIKRTKTHFCKNCGKSTDARHPYCTDTCKTAYKEQHLKMSTTRKKELNKTRVTQARRNIKLLSLEYKGNKCCICGYDKCIRALEFHHLDPSEKESGIGNGSYNKFDKVKLELDKCILVCSNCHAEIHSGMYPQYLK